jgi:hypothetical protein
MVNKAEQGGVMTVANENASVSQIISMVGLPIAFMQIVSEGGEVMAKWPNAPRDRDSFVLNTWHGPLSKTEKLAVYKEALLLAVTDIAARNSCVSDIEFLRSFYIGRAVDSIKKRRNDE